MKLSMPRTISGWCMWLFFLVVGLGLIPAIGGLLPAFLALCLPWLTPSSACSECSTLLMM